MHTIIGRESKLINTIKENYSWHENFPIICVFSSCYMDYQRSWGWNNFQFSEFNLQTITYLLNKKNIYVIFKQHPANEIFPNILEASSNFFENKFNSKRLLIADKEWITKLITLSDGIITPQGTIGIDPLI